MNRKDPEVFIHLDEILTWATQIAVLAMYAAIYRISANPVLFIELVNKYVHVDLTSSVYAFHIGALVIVFFITGIQAMELHGHVTRRLRMIVRKQREDGSRFKNLFLSTLYAVGFGVIAFALTGNLDLYQTGVPIIDAIMLILATAIIWLQWSGFMILVTSSFMVKGKLK